MIRNKYLSLPDNTDPDYDEDVDAQVERLRELLKLMAPDSGTAALGAMRKAAPHVPLSERIKALATYRH
jgi:hypothetical protein